LKALEENNIKHEDISLKRTIGMRFRRQTHELPVPVSTGKFLPEDIDRLVSDFEKLYEEKYGKESGFKEAGVELTTFSLKATGNTPKPKMREIPGHSPDPTPALKGERQAFFGSDSVVVQVYDGLKTQPGNIINGPAIVEYPGTTAVIGPGQKGIVDRFMNIEISR
ncbi:MAG: hypothetical protein U1D67_06685, partial [Dehalococcoidia bacterium]|nr:hypothetical protein [Dehalococcoidia bacterium]